MKKLIALALLAVIGLVLTACHPYGYSYSAGWYSSYPWYPAYDCYYYDYPRYSFSVGVYGDYPRHSGRPHYRPYTRNPRYIGPRHPPRPRPHH